MDTQTFIQLFEQSFRKNFDLPALTDYRTTTSFTYGELAREIAKLHILFNECAIQPGDKISLIGKNTAHWSIVHLATITYGAVIVPILQDFNPNDVGHIINHSESKLLFCSDAIWDNLDEEKLLHIQGAFSMTTLRLLFQRDEEQLDIVLSQLDDKFREKYPNGFTAKDIVYSDLPDSEILVLNYTSGTTGFSKGVMITGGNLKGNMDFAHEIIGLKPGDRMLSFLPLAHTYGAAFDYQYALTEGCDITLLGKTPAPKILVQAFADVKPVLVIAVPLILEKIYRKMIIPILGKKPMTWALSIPVLDTQIYAQIRKKLIHAMGGQLRQVIIGGAAFNSEVEDFLLKIKFPVSVGYGMTECAPLISFSLYPQFVPHSCGKVLASMEARIDSPDPYHIVGEIQVSGQNVMKGYYKNEEATQAVFTEDGWLRTGDLGTIDRNNNLFIRGRCKSMVLGSNGQNIYPEEIEAKLDNLPFVMESLVVERNKKLVALVYPDYDALDAIGLSADDLPLIMEQNLKTLNGRVAAYEKISIIQLYPNEFEKTPKKSIKRYLYN
ncbi:MAG: AMP-binding protein [Dysgonamonadaceae bacterium]|jgi:long-chain acyl-CoA synthetase|nr:AMP-binding protein [Dysgonamonadaceae bacterium]